MPKARVTSALSFQRPIFWWMKWASALWILGAYIGKMFRGGKNPGVAGNPFDQSRPIVHTNPTIEANRPVMPMGLPVDFVGVEPKGLGNCECH